MRERYPGMLAGKVGTLRSGQLPRRMAAEAVAVGQDQPRIALVVRVVASGKRGPQQVLLRHTALVAVAVVVLRQA